MKSTTALDRLGRWVLGLVGVFDANGIVCTTEGTLVSLFILESSLGGTRSALILFVEFGSTCDWADRIYRFGKRKGCDARGRC